MRTPPSLAGLCCTLLLTACSQRAADAPRSATEAESHATAQPNTERHDLVRRAKLTASGVAAQYSVHFDAERLVRIDEQRRTATGALLQSEYTYQGARLLHYRGSKLIEPTPIDLQFDVQGVLLSQQGDVSDAELDAIRARAQLLRSHALAQRASRAHTTGH